MVDLVVRMPGVADAGAALGNGTYLVGSGEECHIRLPRPDISRRHAQLIISESAIVIMDMKMADPRGTGFQPLHDGNFGIGVDVSDVQTHPQARIVHTFYDVR